MPRPKIEFDAATHTYTVDGIVRPSVTQVLQATGYSDFSMVPEHILLRGQKRGTIVHDATAIIDDPDYDLDWDELDDTCRPYIEAYRTFKEQSGFRPIKVEYQVYNESYQFAGTLDRTGWLNNQKVLIDFKTGSVKGEAIRMQLHAYHQCLNDDPHVMYALQLRKDGSYRLSSPIHFDIRTWVKFGHMVKTYNYWLQDGIIKREEAE